MNNYCPLCGSSDVKKSKKGYSVKKSAGNNYLKSTNFESLDDIDNSLKFFYCNHCGTGWRGDSKISKEIDGIYHKNHSLHWKSFEVFRNTLACNNSYSHLEGLEILLIKYRNFINKDIDIIEIGSPTLGFGFQFSNLNLIKKIKSYKRNIKNLDFLLLVQEKTTFSLISFFRFLNLTKKKIKKLFRLKTVEHKLFNNFKSIKFYEIPTTIGWGTSSIICGHSTLKWLLYLNPDIELINKYKTENIYSDLSICINYLDHFDKPVEIIKEMLFISRLMIFNIHKQFDAASQHKYTYSNNFDKSVTSLLDKKYICLRISSKIYKIPNQNKFNYFIVGEKNHVSNYLNFLKEQTH